MFGGDADAQREAVEARSSVDVETRGAPREESLIGPTRPRQHRPVEAQGDEPDLAAVGMAREDEVDVVLGQRAESDRIVEQE